MTGDFGGPIRCHIYTYFFPSKYEYIVRKLTPATALSKMDTVNVRELVERLGNEHDGARKKAAFGLQSYIGDPSFADVFIAEGGLVNLRMLALTANGNTLAYSLTSLAKLLEVDKGWDHVSEALVERVSAKLHRDPARARRMPDGLSPCLIYGRGSKISGRGARGHASAGQHPTRGHVHPRRHRIALPTWSGTGTRVSKRFVWLSSLEARLGRLSRIPRDAGQSIVIGGSCPLRQRSATDQFAHAGRYGGRVRPGVAQVHQAITGPWSDQGRLCAFGIIVHYPCDASIRLD